MRTEREQSPRRCRGCGVTITWTPVEKEGAVYCCESCALGSPCLCKQLQAIPLPPRGQGSGAGATQRNRRMQKEMLERIGDIVARHGAALKERAKASSK